MSKKDYKIIKFIIFLIILIGAIIICWNPLANLFSDLENIKELIQSFKILAPIIFIIIVILQVLLAPIPGQVTGLAGGYIFGVFPGTLYGIIGLIIGSFIAFSLSRKFGRPFVEKVVNKKTLNKFDKISLGTGVFGLFLIYLLPALPDDVICYIAGLTKIKISTLVIISAIGRLPGFFALSVIGAGLAIENTVFSIILLVMIIGAIIIYFNRNKIEKIIMKKIKKLKNNLHNKKWIKKKY